MILDATVGDYVGDFRMAEHNSIPMIRMMLESFKTCDIITDKTQLILSHLAHSLYKETYKDYAPRLLKEGLLVAYDGMTIDI